MVDGAAGCPAVGRARIAGGEKGGRASGPSTVLAFGSKDYALVHDDAHTTGPRVRKQDRR
jgi:hypothetical protein